MALAGSRATKHIAHDSDGNRVTWTSKDRVYTHAVITHHGIDIKAAWASSLALAEVEAKRRRAAVYRDGSPYYDLVEVVPAQIVGGRP